jgi:hypothetical protein
VGHPAHQLRDWRITEARPFGEYDAGQLSTTQWRARRVDGEFVIVSQRVGILRDKMALILFLTKVPNHGCYHPFRAIRAYNETVIQVHRERVLSVGIKDFSKLVIQLQVYGHKQRVGLLRGQCLVHHRN